MDPFANAAEVERYVDVTPRRVPGYDDLHRMVSVLLAERTPHDASILVLGAGGGLELKSFAQSRPGWSFVGVDPSRPMLDLAVEVLGALGSRVELIHGDVNDAPSRLFDGAVCLLTLHFLSLSERAQVLLRLKERLTPGAPLIVAHHCIPDSASAETWLARSVAFATGHNAIDEAARASAATMAQKLSLLTTHDEEVLLLQSGFAEPALFYAALSFRGWVAHAAET